LQLFFRAWNTTLWRLRQEDQESEARGPVSKAKQMNNNNKYHSVECQAKGRGKEEEVKITAQGNFGKEWLLSQPCFKGPVTIQVTEAPALDTSDWVLCPSLCHTAQNQAIAVTYLHTDLIPNSEATSRSRIAGHRAQAVQRAFCCCWVVYFVLVLGINV
jgi:hypothetical protein